MTLGQLMELHVNGALKIKHEDNSAVALLGGTTQITVEQAESLCAQFGWTEHYINAFDAIAKTNSIMSTFKKSSLFTDWSDTIWNTTEIEFQNKRSNTYGKTFDRYVLYFQNSRRVTIIHGMEHLGASYAIYLDGSSIPSAKCRTLSKVAEYLVGVI